MKKTVIALVVAVAGIVCLVSDLITKDRLSTNSRPQEAIASSPTESPPVPELPPVIEPAATGSSVKRPSATPSPPAAAPAATGHDHMGLARPRAPKTGKDGETAVRLLSRGTYRARMDEIQGLGTTLSEAQIEGLYEFLTSRFDQQDTLDAVHFNSLKNQALDKLIEQDELPSDLGLFIVATYRDRAHDALWRDYCVQHFALYCERKWGADVAPADDPERLAIVDAYWEAADESENGIAGTALLGLERMSETDPRFNRERVRQYVYRYASNDSTPLATRITAMQLCARTGEQAILPIARTAAQSAASIPLRMASIATVGDIGDHRDVDFLEKLIPNTRGYVRKAARSALTRLRQRLNSPG